MGSCTPWLTFGNGDGDRFAIRGFAGQPANLYPCNAWCSLTAKPRGTDGTAANSSTVACSRSHMRG